MGNLIAKPVKPINYVVIDMDNCLYRTKEIIDKTGKNIQDYMVNHLGYTPENVSVEEDMFYKGYGNTLRGLAKLGHKIKFKNWFDKVHKPLPYDLILPDPALRDILLKLKASGAILILFTNSDREHADKVLARLGISDCFENDNIIDFNRLNLYENSSKNVDIICKPNINAYEILLKLLNIYPGSDITFIDDSLSNLKAGATIGWKGIQIGVAEIKEPSVAAYPTIHGISEYFGL